VGLTNTPQEAGSFKFRFIIPLYVVDKWYRYRCYFNTTVLSRSCTFAIHQCTGAHMTPTL